MNTFIDVLIIILISVTALSLIALLVLFIIKLILQKKNPSLEEKQEEPKLEEEPKVEEEPAPIEEQPKEESLSDDNNKVEKVVIIDHRRKQ